MRRGTTRRAVPTRSRPPYLARRLPVTIPPTRRRVAVDGREPDAAVQTSRVNPSSDLPRFRGFPLDVVRLHVPEASVLTALLKSSAVDKYQPVVTILGSADKSESRAASGGSRSIHGSCRARDELRARRARTTSGSRRSATRSPRRTSSPIDHVDRVAARRHAPADPGARLGQDQDRRREQDVHVRRDASTDGGSGLDQSTRRLAFYDNGQPFPGNVSGRRKLMATYAWKTPGLQRSR